MVRSLEALKKRAEKRGISLKEMMLKDKPTSSKREEKGKKTVDPAKEKRISKIKSDTVPPRPHNATHQSSADPHIPSSGRDSSSNKQKNSKTGNIETQKDHNKKSSDNNNRKGWLCKFCNNDNFAYRTECNRCCRPKSASHPV